MAAKSQDLTRLPRRPARRADSGCPICKELPTLRYRPFCSPRCADIDLGRWLKESYRVAGEPVDQSGPAEESEPD